MTTNVCSIYDKYLKILGGIHGKDREAFLYGSLISIAAKSGSTAASVAVQKGLDIESDTVVDMAQNISQGKKITPTSVAGSLAFNIVTAGNTNGSRKSVTNAITDSTEDSVRRKEKGSLGDSVSRGGLNSERVGYYLNKSRNNMDSDTVILGSTGKYELLLKIKDIHILK